MIKTLKIFPLLFTVPSSKNSGTISDDNSEPLIGANVIISSDFNTGAATDQNGYFTINSVLLMETMIYGFLILVMVIIKIKYQLPTILHLMNFN